MMNRIFGNLSDVCVKRNEQSVALKAHPAVAFARAREAESRGGLSDTEDA